ncbi:MAG: DUF3667 domain-containing protein [Rhodanobacter sp.]
MKQLTISEGLCCANCGAPMQGKFCHECGQSIHSVLKPVHAMIEESVETVFHIDGRIVHTVPPLLLKPGFLTLEYFSGRRIRYIAPVRLMFVLSLLSFFVFHLAINQLDSRGAFADDASVSSDDTSAIAQADRPEAVRAALAVQLNALNSARATGLLSQAVLAQTDIAASELRRKASERLVALGAAPMSAASIATPLPIISTREPALSKNNGPQTAVSVESKHRRIEWLPDMANDRLAEFNDRARDNVSALMNGDQKTRAQAKQRMISGVFSMLPPVMFVLIPVFAALLKLFYVFRRRLYMEHLIVALHSHAFIFLSLLLITLVGMASTWLRPHAAWTGYAFGWLQALLLLWMPVYLLMMQKRIYRQSWPMTLLKFGCIGWCYVWLLTLALGVAAMLGIAH